MLFFHENFGCVISNIKLDFLGLADAEAKCVTGAWQAALKHRLNTHPCITQNSLPFPKVSIHIFLIKSCKKCFKIFKK